ncbi:hypothetical protein AAFC00_001446 [Neodothiora populina]|uniref:Uncharacterized protein n=1 Tax=Neodothiora populina TaxID=2781224 RepID=A0ABR3PPA8_9PEZI
MSTASSRRPSHTANMPPPSGTMHSGSGMMTSADSQIPMRHPRPLTAAELHLELEQEQEAVVNRLTRELSALRAHHSASVASNSSTGSHQTPSLLPLDQPSHPIASRQRRSSSTASSRSAGLETPSTGASSILGTASAPLGGVSQASADRAAAAGGSLSRNPSVRSTSGTSTPARPSVDYSTSFHSLVLPHRPSMSHAPSSVSNMSNAGSIQAQGPTSPHVNPTQHYIDAAAAKAELELVKEENEALRQRIRNLEQTLRTRRRESQASPNSESGASRERSLSRPSPQQQTVSLHHPATSGAGGLNITSWAAGTTVAGPRERSESQSTTASTRRALATDEREDSIRVGESAASGVSNGRPPAGT